MRGFHVLLLMAEAYDAFNWLMFKCAVPTAEEKGAGEVLKADEVVPSEDVQVCIQTCCMHSCSAEHIIS